MDSKELRIIRGKAMRWALPSRPIRHSWKRDCHLRGVDGLQLAFPAWEALNTYTDLERADKVKRLRRLRHGAIKKYSWSSFSQVFYPYQNIRSLRPSHWNCEGCSSWDDINGCWQDHGTILTCPEQGEEGLLADEEEVPGDRRPGHGTFDEAEY